MMANQTGWPTMAVGRWSNGGGRRGSMKNTCVGIVLLASALSCAALDSLDLLFHLSFENGVTPELARGSAAPVTMPTELERRLVDGLFGKGYLFAGKGSGIQYATGNTAGPSACDEMYTTPANFFGDSGTVAFWMKPLGNAHNGEHYMFLCNGPGGIFQIMKDGTWSYHYAGGTVGITDGTYRLNAGLAFKKAWEDPLPLRLCVREDDLLGQIKNPT